MPIKTVNKIFAFLLLFVVFPAVSARAEIRYDDILELSEKQEPAAMKFVREKGGSFFPVSSGRSFVVWWAPEGFDAKRDPVLVSLHGHAGWAAKDFEVWYPYLKERKFAYLGIQWWFGRSMEIFGYAEPREIVRWAREALEQRGIPKKHAVLQGFSMGSANSYAVTFIDRRQTEPYFAVTISNAGQLEDDYPPNRGFLSGPQSDRPFAGARWILYCGEKDPQHGCGPMKETREKLESLGAVIDAFIDDPQGDHGGFMRRKHAGYALDLSEKIMKEENSKK